MDIEKFAERAAAAVRRLMQRELAAVERKWSETLGELRKAFDERLAEVAAKVPTKGEPGLDGKDALEIVIQPELDDAEMRALHASADALRREARSLGSEAPASGAGGVASGALRIRRGNLLRGHEINDGQRRPAGRGIRRGRHFPPPPQAAEPKSLERLQRSEAQSR